MSRLRELPVWPEKVVGAHHIRSLERLIEGLREETPHGNRELFLDVDVFTALLPGLLSTARCGPCGPLRTPARPGRLSNMPDDRKALQKHPFRLQQARRPHPLAADHRITSRQEVFKADSQAARRAGSLDHLHRQISAVDGTFLKAGPPTPSSGPCAPLRRQDRGRGSISMSTSRPGFRIDRRSRAGRERGRDRREIDHRRSHSSLRPRDLQLRARDGPRGKECRLRDATPRARAANPQPRNRRDPPTQEGARMPTR